MTIPVHYPPTDSAGWRRRAAALAQLWAALAEAAYGVGNHGEWKVIAEPGDLPRWLDLVDAVVPAPQPDVLRYRFLRAWTSDPESTRGRTTTPSPRCTCNCVAAIGSCVWASARTSVRSSSPRGCPRPGLEVHGGDSAWWARWAERWMPYAERACFQINPDTRPPSTTN